MATILIHNASKKRLAVKHLCKIDRYEAGKINYSDLPIEVIIKDESTNETFPAKLIEVLPFSSSIPSILSLLAAECSPEELLKQMYEKKKIYNVNQLAFYLYEH